MTEKLQVAGVRTVPFGARQRRSFVGDLLTFGSLFSLLHIIRTEKPDVVHANSAKAGGLGCLAGRMAGIKKILFTAHGWEFNAPRGTLSKIGMRFFSWLTILLSHETICVSEKVRDDVVRFLFIGKKFTVIHNGILCKELRARADARASLLPGHEHAFWIGMVSELHPTKRIEDALHALKMLVGIYPNLLLVVLGEGSERAKLESLIGALGLRDRAFLRGFVADAPQYEKAFDIFLHTSQSEALAYAILEAGCASLPVVATRVGGIPEIIEDGVSGLLVPPHNPHATAAALESLITDPARAHALGTALHTCVLTNFSQSKMLDATFACYSSASPLK